MLQLEGVKFASRVNELMNPEVLPLSQPSRLLSRLLRLVSQLGPQTCTSSHWVDFSHDPQIVGETVSSLNGLNKRSNVNTPYFLIRYCMCRVLLPLISSSDMACRTLFPLNSYQICAKGVQGKSRGSGDPLGLVQSGVKIGGVGNKGGIRGP